jgi:GH25 family lysozyme M1 (1,4-beta-N-acetylmuramidase)
MGRKSHCPTAATMKFTTVFALLATGLAASAVPLEDALDKRAHPSGIDVSHYQGTINWNNVKAKGISFAFIKATEGTCGYPFSNSLRFYRD